jgi:NAD dependent epimerase/dehydratase family enzyme
VILRFGIVLGKESVAFPKLSTPMSFGIKPVLGSGRQVVSWIEVDDLARFILFSIENPAIEGTYNAVTPNPVTHIELMNTIANAKGGIKIPVAAPAFVLKTVLGEMSNEVLKSCTVSAEKTLNTGFTFKHPEITSAVKAILNAG